MKYLRAIGATIVWWLASLTFSCYDKLWGQQWSVTPAIWDSLAQLADSATVEHARCFQGWAAHDTLKVTILEPIADQLAITPDSTVSVLAGANVVAGLGCGPVALGTWHNHLYRQGGQPVTNLPAALCYLSLTDIQSATNPLAPALEVVQVDHATLCWWWKYQVLWMWEHLRNATGDRLHVFPAIRQQIIYDTSHTAPIVVVVP